MSFYMGEIMHPSRISTNRSFAALALMALFCLTTVGVPCRAAAPPKVKQVYSAAETKDFKALANATIAAIDAKDEKGMVAKITDLETAWDAKEDTLKPKDPDTWTAIDKTLDKGISALRSSKTDIPKGKAALQQLVQMLDAATKP